MTESEQKAINNRDILHLMFNDETKGGVIEAGVAVLVEGGLGNMVSEAVSAAVQRAKEMRD